MNKIFQKCPLQSPSPERLFGLLIDALPFFCLEADVLGGAPIFGEL